jgi:YgiT-type zinc finger domain-containing protein
MRCVVCRQGETRPGKTAVVLQRDGATVVINDVPARVCENCGEDHVDEQVAERVLAAAVAAARPGVKVEIRDYVAA